jgi:ATP-dependent Clp endopeptidase proteolytic subunit ClpP
MDAREKFALQKEVRSDLEKLNDPGATARDKFALQKQIRANLEKLGKGVKDENPNVQTPLFDKLVVGDFDMNNLEVLQKFLTDVYNELKSAGIDEAEAIAKMKQPLKEQILKSDVIQEMVGTDLSPDEFKKFKNGLEGLIDGIGASSEPSEPSHSELVEENVSILSAKLDLDEEIVRQECFHEDNLEGEIVEGVYKSKFDENDRFVLSGIVKSAWMNSARPVSENSKTFEYGIELRYKIDGKEKQQHIYLEFPNKKEYQSLYEAGEEIGFDFRAVAIRFKDGQASYDLELDYSKIKGAVNPHDDPTSAFNDHRSPTLRDIPEKALKRKEKTVQEDVGDIDITKRNFLLPIKPPVVPRPNPSLAEKGIFFLNTEISDDSVFPILQEIVKQNALQAKNRLENFKVVVSSNGGSVEAAFSFIDIMMTSKVPIHTVAMGKVKSAGLLIAMSGAPEHRSIFPNTSVMSHQFAWGMQGKESAMNATQVEVGNVSKRILKHYKECTGLAPAKIKKELLPDTDRWLTAKQAIEYNLFDKIESGEFYHATDEPEDLDPEAKKDEPVEENVADEPIEDPNNSESENSADPENDLGDQEPAAGDDGADDLGDGDPESELSDELEGAQGANA